MVVVRIEPFGVESAAGSFGGPNLSLDLRLLELVAVHQPMSSSSLADLLFPGMAERWGEERLPHLKYLLEQRLGEPAIRPGREGWRLSRACRIERWPRPTLGPERDALLEELRMAGPGGLAARALSERLGVSQEALRRRVSRLRKRGERRILSGGGGYRIRLGPG